MMEQNVRLSMGKQFYEVLSENIRSIAIHSARGDIRAWHLTLKAFFEITCWKLKKEKQEKYTKRFRTIEEDLSKTSGTDTLYHEQVAQEQITKFKKVTDALHQLQIDYFNDIKNLLTYVEDVDRTKVMET